MAKAKNEMYQSAQTGFQNSSQDMNAANQNFGKVSNATTGIAGNNAAMDMAVKNASLVSNAQGAAAQQNSRQNGLSKQAAAMAGSQTASNAMGNNVTSQQGIAKSMLDSQLAAEQQKFSNANTAANTHLGYMSNVSNEYSKQAERKNNNLAAGAGLVGNVIGGAISMFSDGNMKNAEPVTKGENPYNCDIDKMLSNAKPMKTKLSELVYKEK